MKKVRLMMKMVGLFVGPAIIAVALTIWREAAEKRLSPQEARPPRPCRALGGFRAGMPRRAPAAR
jgi:hypothetical protein